MGETFLTWASALIMTPNRMTLAVGLIVLAFGPTSAFGQSPILDSGCTTQGKDEININCEYLDSGEPVATVTDPQIALNRAVLSFKTRDENYMSVELTFTRRGDARVTSARPVYLAIDDDIGRNLIRRFLVHVDLRNLERGKPSTFSDRILIGTIRPGHYQVHLWIPSSDPPAAFDVARNLMLSNLNIANRQSGLNTIAGFSIIP